MRADIQHYIKFGAVGRADCFAVNDDRANVRAAALRLLPAEMHLDLFVRQKRPAIRTRGRLVVDFLPAFGTLDERRVCSSFLFYDLLKRGSSVGFAVLITALCILNSLLQIFPRWMNFLLYPHAVLLACRFFH